MKKSILLLQDHDNPIRSKIFLLLVVTGSFDGVIRTWHPGSSKPVTSVKTHHCSVPHVIFIDEACQFIACGNDRVRKYRWI